MKNLMLIALWMACFVFSSFDEPTNYEQIAFDYFMAEIIPSDFEDVSALEFKGRTEKTYASLGRFEFCLPPTRLQSPIREMTRRPPGRAAKELINIDYDHVKAVTITEFKQSSKAPKLFIYRSLRLADNFYVFLGVKKTNKPLARYVLEINANGNISRTCKME